MIKDISITLKDFLHFLKSPRDRFSDRITANDRYRIFTVLFFAILLLNALFIVPLLGFVHEYIMKIEAAGLLRNFSIGMMLFMAVVAAPILEEILFRLPLKYERNYVLRVLDKIAGKPVFFNFWKRNFAVIFYLVAILFGFVHSFNYKNEWNALFLVLLPIIILSQSIGGLFMGYIRLRLGFFWAILFHACFNFVVITVPYLLHENIEYINQKNGDYELRVEGLFCKESISTTITHQKTVDEKILMIEATNTDLQTLVELTIGKGHKVLDNQLVHFYFKSQKGLTEQELINLLKEEFEITEK